METLELRRPHGFLVWTGKKQAVLTTGRLPVGDGLEVSQDGELFGVAVLGEPALMTGSEADRREWFDQHRVFPRERREWWPGEKEFRVYPVERFFAYPRIGRAWFKEATEGEDCPSCTHDGGGWCRLHDELVEGGKACDDWQGFADWRTAPKEVDEMPWEKFKDGDKWCVRRADTKKLMHCYEGSGAEGKADKYLVALRMNAHKDAVDPLEFEWPLDEDLEFEWEEDGEKKRGHMPGLTKHIVKHWGNDPHLFTKCMESDIEALAGYDQETRAAICARAHKIATGIWPGEHGGEDPAGPKSFDGLTDEQKQLILDGVLEIIDGEKEEVEPEAEADGAGVTEEELPVNDEEPCTCQDGEEADCVCAEWEAPAMSEDTEKSLRTWFQGKFDELKAAFARELEPEGEGEGELLVPAFSIKMVDGDPWIVTYSSNAFIDRDEEIFSTKGLERYVAAAEEKGDRGMFNFWHVPGTDFAEKRWQGVVGDTGGILVEAGPFLDTSLGRAARKFFAKYPDGHPEVAPEGWGCSVEYRYLPEERKGGVYDNFWVTRTSLLPRHVAANTRTKGGVVMALTKKQKEGLVELFPDDAESIIEDAEDRAAQYKAEGVEHKAAEEKAITKDKLAAALRKLAGSTDDEKIAGKLNDLAGALGEDEDEDEDEGDGEKEFTIDVEELAREMAKQFDVELEPIQDLQEQNAAMREQLEALTAQIARMRGAGADEDQKTRFTLSLEKRASRAEETALEDDDPLLQQKPQEAKDTARSGADHFFPPK